MLIINFFFTWIDFSSSDSITNSLEKRKKEKGISSLQLDRFYIIGNIDFCFCLVGR